MNKTSRNQGIFLPVIASILFLILGLFVGMNLSQKNNQQLDYSQEVRTQASESPQVFTTDEAARPESILKSMYDAQLDCLNTYNINGVPVNLSSDQCLKMTNIYTVNSQNLKVNCSPQNTPSKQQIKINPATINGNIATIIVDTNWDGGTSTRTDTQLKLINKVWKVTSITCKD